MGAVTIRVRPAEPKDTEAIIGILSRNGLGSFDPARWREGWDDYPFAEQFRDIPTGWVLETESGALVGNLNNIHMLYEMNGRPLRGTIAAGWAVDAEYRGKSLRLMTTFFRQGGVDIYLNVSASPATAQILTGMKIPRIPIPDYGTPCLWALRPRAFARAALSRRSIPCAGALAWPAGLLLLVGDIVRRSGQGRLSSRIRRLDRFDDRIDTLYREIRAGAPRLRAVRTREVLEWRFRAEIRERRIAIVAAERGATLLGYAVLVRRAGSELGMEMYDVADVQATGDDPAIVRDLLLGSIEIARADKMDALKFVTGMPARRRPAEQLRPWTYRLPFWQQYFQTATPELATALSSADAWDFSVFDTF
jgi:hypothetical protein